MKSILQSIKPQYCELIASGKKTIEVRKTRTKLDVPFKVYIYETKSSYINGLNGTVIGEYVCDRIEPKYCANGIAAYYENEEGTCLSDAELIMYADGVKPLYFWHISHLKIYDKPKELSEFEHLCDGNCDGCKYSFLEEGGYFYSEPKLRCDNTIKRPPQSWCYVEEV